MVHREGKRSQALCASQKHIGLAVVIFPVPRNPDWSVLALVVFRSRLDQVRDDFQEIGGAFVSFSIEGIG